MLRDSGVECLVTRIHSAIFCTIEEVDAQVMCYYCSINLASHLKTSLDLTGYSSHCGQMVEFKGKTKVVLFLPFILAKNLYKNFFVGYSICTFGAFKNYTSMLSRIP